MGQARLADRQVVVDRGEGDVGNHTAVLSGGTVGQIKFLDGQLGRTGLAGVLSKAGEIIFHLEHRLHRAFAVSGTVADDDGAAVILERTGEDLRGGGAEAGRQHGERSIVGDRGICLAVDGGAAERILDLHDRALPDEEAGEFDGFGEQAATVAAQVDDERLDAFLLQFADEFGHVLRASALRFAGSGVFGRSVEGVERDDTDGRNLAVGRGHFVDGGLRAGGIDLDDVARDGDLLGLAGVRRVVGLDGEDNLGVLRAAHHVDDATQLHAEHLDGFGAGLFDRENLVVDFNLPAEVGRAAGDDFTHDAVAVLFGAQDRTDADERKFHLNAEILEAVGGEIRGVRVIHPRQAGEIHFLNVGGLDVADVFEHAFVALAHGGLGIAEGLVVDEVLHEFELHPAAPEIVGLGRVRGPRVFRAVRRVGFLRLEIVILLEFVEDPVGPAIHALLVEMENVEGGVDVAEVGEVGLNAGAELLAQSLFILAGEKETLRVELGHVVRHQLRVIGRRHRVLVVVIILQHLDQRAHFEAHDRRGLVVAVNCAEERGGGAEDQN